MLGGGEGACPASHPKQKMKFYKYIYLIFVSLWSSCSSQSFSSYGGLQLSWGMEGVKGRVSILPRSHLGHPSALGGTASFF